jgi:hypothetical protein
LHEAVERIPQSMGKRGSHLCDDLHPHPASNTMNTFLVDFAFCPCGEVTAIQPTKLAIPDTEVVPVFRNRSHGLVPCLEISQNTESHLTTLRFGTFRDW